MTLETPRLLLLLFPMLLLIVAAGLEVSGPRVVQWTRIACRSLLVISVTILVSGPEERTVASVRGPTGILLDASMSLSDADLIASLDQLSAFEGDAPLILPFAGSTLPPTDRETFVKLASNRVPSDHDWSASELAPTLKFALGLGSGRKSYLLISDGLLFDQGPAISVARELGLRLDTWAIGPTEGIDTSLVSLRAPTRLRLGEPSTLEFDVETFRSDTTPIPPREVILTIGEEEVVRQLLPTGAGPHRLAFALTSSPPGPISLRLTVSAKEEVDTRNDSLGWELDLIQPPRGLLIGASRGSDLIERALAPQNILLERRPDLDGFDSADDLTDFDCLILGPGGDGLDQTDELLLSDYVSYGGGLLIFLDGARGGTLPAVEGPLRPILPLELPSSPPMEPTPSNPNPGDDPSETQDPSPPPPIEEEPSPNDEDPNSPDSGNLPPKEESPEIDASKPTPKRIEGASLTLLLVLDTSNSMQGGKLTSAKAAALAAAQTLQPVDRIGVLAFADEPRWILPPTSASRRRDLVDRLADLTPGGQTFFYPALEAARDALLDEPSRIRHVIFLTDGESREFKGFRSLILGMRRNFITLSTVGLGQAFDASRLGQFAEWGGGSFYPVYDYRKIPEIYSLEVGRVLGEAFDLEAPEAVLPDDDLAEVPPNPELHPGTTSARDPSETEASDSSTSETTPPGVEVSQTTPGESLSEKTSDRRPPDPRSPTETDNPDPADPLALQKVLARGPSPFLGGLDPESLPGIREIVETTPKMGAWIPFETDRRTPFLGFWVTGSGRVATITADLGSSANEPWSSYPELPALLGQTLRSLESDTLRETLGEAVVEQPGELRRLLPDRSALEELSRATGGTAHSTAPRTLPRTTESVETVTDRSLPLLILALLLLPCDLVLGRMRRRALTESSQAG